ncbi:MULTISPECIES: hypothetical protein [Mycolicibacterium]|uniref:hypothetical protein n=1 Tax=Mycolicibacterium TaxID=1866885 RepID=UPI001CDC5408|nr:hypothetical protein [Mycolicibacterium fortuitum]UBV20395.1 hypothetical protein H8Z59_24485 [Mycolicibacterium fortuitum]
MISTVTQHSTHWDVTVLGCDVTVRDVRGSSDTPGGWLVFNHYGQSLPESNVVAAAAIAAVIDAQRVDAGAGL